jgi:hypothetical protein
MRARRCGRVASLLAQARRAEGIFEIEKNGTNVALSFNNRKIPEGVLV